VPRKLRIEYEGAIYHVMNRGDRQEAIFRDDDDRKLFLRTLGEACVKTNWQVHAYCLMRNHFHLVVETPKANLSLGMQWFLGTYTARFNRRHRCFGHLFSGRFKALVVDGSGNGYLKTVCDYVHLNPVRARLLKQEQPLREYVWSSYPEYLRKPGQRPNWLRVDRLLGETGIPKDSAAGRRRLEEVTEERKRQEMKEPSGEWKKIRRGWCFGEEAFREELLEQAATKRGQQHDGEAVRESAEQEANRVIREMLAAAKVAPTGLRNRLKGDALKVRIASRLRRETTMTWKWIAARLEMGQWKSAANGVRLARGKRESRNFKV
jgi:putative transposase